MKIYTRRGDQGETDLFGGPRVAKDDPRVEAYGALDELNAVLGLGAAETRHDDIRTVCLEIQQTLFALGAYLASPDPERRSRSGIDDPDAKDVERIEARIDAFEGELPPLRRFVLPGGTPAAARLHLARTVCRRSERRAVELNRQQPLDPVALRYLNRLSDLLFVLARIENHRAGVGDVEWTGRQG